MNHIDGLLAGRQFQGNTQQNGPEQNTDIIGLGQ